MEKSLDLPSVKLLKDKLNQLERRIEREREARKNAEKILEIKSFELYSSNQSLVFLNDQLEIQLEQNRQFLQSINDFSGYLVGKNDLQEIASIITERLISKYDLEDCIIYKVANGYCHQISAFGSSRDGLNEKIKIGDGIVGNVAKTGLAEILSDTSKYNPYISKDQDGVRVSKLTVPIKFEGLVIGIIDTGHSQKDFFNNIHLKTITTISSLISVLFKNSLTEQKNLNLESGIEKRSEIINSLVHNLHSGLVLNDEHGKIVLINDAFRKIFNLSFPASEILGKDQRESANLIKNRFKEPQKFIDIVDYCREFNKNVSQNELEMADGTILDCGFIPIYSKNELIGQMWQVTDVTDSRSYQKKVQASEEKYRGIIENMELGLLEVDLESKVIKAYEWFCRMTGYEEKELIGKDARKVFFSDKYIKLMDKQDALRMKGEQSIYEVQMRKKNGELIWVLISGAPFYNQKGEIVGTIGIHYNIDSRKKLEEDLKQSKLQTEKAREAEKQFLANMSHEIRNPLNAIIGITNLLYDTKPTTEQLNHLDKIKYSSDILLGLISGILDISKIESGTLELTEKEINISEIVNGLIQITGFNDREKKVRYVNKLILTDEFEVMADPTALNQIFLNLLNNASKFTAEGVITIDGKVIESEQEYANFEFRVSDTGIGIASEKLDSIFNIFQQVDRETKLKYGGSGLGLNIVKKLVSMYNGAVRAESKVNEGTTIIFNLKLKRVSKLNPEEKNISYEFKKNGRILVVEDNEINQYYLSGILNKWNIGHDVANNGFEALVKLEKNKYNLILMDIRMPRMDGYETTIKLRSMIQNPNCAVPIIALTASALIDEREKAMQVGMNYHLTKPYTEYDLGDALSRFGIITKIDQHDTKGFQFSPEIDFGNLESYYQDNIERAQKIFEVFIRVIDVDFLKLKESIQNENWNKVSSLAHKIKPNFAMVGLTDLSKLMEHYEKSKINIEIRSEITLNFSKLETDFNAGKLIVQKELTKINKYLKK